MKPHIEDAVEEAGNAFASGVREGDRLGHSEISVRIVEAANRALRRRGIGLVIEDAGVRGWLVEVAGEDGV